MKIRSGFVSNSSSSSFCLVGWVINIDENTIYNKIFEMFGIDQNEFDARIKGKDVDEISEVMSEYCNSGEQDDDFYIFYDYENETPRFVCGYGNADDECEINELSVNQIYRFKKIAENTFSELGTPKVIGGQCSRG